MRDKESKMKPFFSIIIPCCNVEPYIEECLLSILDQPFQDWECLVVVESSRDRTEQIVRAFAEKNKRIRFFKQDRSGSPSAGRNTGLDHAQGKYVIFVDGDDYIRKNKLAELAAGIAEHPDADLYPCAIFAHDTRTGKDEIRDNYPKEASSEMSFPEAISFLRHVYPPCPMAQMTICRLEFLNQTHLRFVYGLKHEDNEFSPRALYLAKRIVPLHIQFYFYRIVPNSITTAEGRHRGQKLKAFARVFRNLINFYADVSETPGFDPVISEYWANQWLSAIFGQWFFPQSNKTVPYKYQIATLRFLFSGTLNDFQHLVKHASSAKRFASRFLLLPVKHPWTIGISIAFFQLYFRLSNIKGNAMSSSRSPVP